MVEAATVSLLGAGAREPQRDHSRRRADDRLPEQLLPHAQSEAVALAHLEEVVDEADQRRGRRSRPSSTTPVVVMPVGAPSCLGRQSGEHEVAGHVGDHRGQDEDDAAHGRRALLAQVGLRAIRTDRLAGLEPGERPDGQRREQDRDEERDRGRDDDRPHASPPELASAVLPALAPRASRLPPSTRPRVAGQPRPRCGSANPSPGRRRPGAAHLAATPRPRPDRTPPPTLLPIPVPPPRRRGSARRPRRPPRAAPRPVRPRAGRPASCPSRSIAPELGQVAEHGDASPTSPDRGQRVQRGRGRRRVGVVRVVDDRDTIGPVEDIHPSARDQPQIAECRPERRPAACPAPVRPPRRAGVDRPDAGRRRRASTAAVPSGVRSV